jgi:flagellar motor switch protein FliN/FliY
MPDDTPPAGSGGISDADIDALLAEINASGPADQVAENAVESASAAATDIDALLESAMFESAESASPAAMPHIPDPPTQFNTDAAHTPAPTLIAPDAIAMDLPELQAAMAAAQASSIDLLRDVDLNVKIELGRSRMLVEDVLRLSEGSVVELDKLAGDPVDVYVNDRLVARGEVLVLNEQFCVRVNEIVATREDLM